MFIQAIKNDLFVKTKHFYKMFGVFSIISALMFISFFCPPFVYVAFGLSIGLMLLLKGNKKLYIILFLLPYYNIFRTSIEMSSLTSYLNIICLGLFAIEYIIDLIKKNKKLNIPLLISFGLIAIYVTIPFSGTFNVANLFKMYFALGILYLAYIYKETASLKELTYVLVYGILTACLISLAKPLSPHLQSFLMDIPMGTGNLVRFTALFNDPNFLAFEVFIGIVLISQLFLNKHIFIMYPILLLPLFCIGLATASKTYLLCTACYIMVLMATAIFRGIKNKKLNLFLEISVPIIISITLGCLLSLEIVQAIIKRFGEISYMDFGNTTAIFKNMLSGGASVGNLNVSINSFTTGRSEIWTQYINAIISSPKTILFGHGISAPLLVLPNGVETSSHNFYLELLYTFGLVGLILIAIPFIYLVCKTFKKKNVGFLNLIPTLSLLVILFTYNCIFTHRLSLLIIIFAYSLFYNNLTTKETEVQ